MQVINRSGENLNEEFLSKVVSDILKSEVGRDDAVLVFVEEDEIRKLNESFRGIEGPTDVLTFVYNDEDILGEIVVCPRVVLRNSKEYGVNHEEELLRVVIHGALHLSGYDHERDISRAEEMMKKQEELVKKYSGVSRG